MLHGRPWPKVSIVTPSFNQSQFVEETIRSVLLQGYPDLEYIIMDGGSTDGSVDIIRRYQEHLTYWKSERDLGQAHAINQGFQRATGDILAWLNSDDIYCLNAVRAVAEFFESNPDVAVAYGRADAIDAPGRVILQRPAREFSLTQCLAGLESPIDQPAAFIRRETIRRVGPLNQELHYVMDRDLWTRAFIAGQRLSPIEETLARFRVHPEAKTAGRLASAGEELTMWVDRFFSQPLPSSIKCLERQSRGRAFFALASGNFSADRFLSGRRAVLRGAALCPRNLLAPSGLLLLLTALLPGPGIKLARFVRRKLSRYYEARWSKSTGRTA